MVMVNIDNLPVSQFATIFEASGVAKRAYKPTGAAVPYNQWPTLGNLIDANTNFVVFIDNQAKFDEVPYIIDEFTNIWEDAYGECTHRCRPGTKTQAENVARTVLTIADATTQDFGCAVNRTKGTADQQMYMINHFLDQSFNLLGMQVLTPNQAKLNETNAATGPGSIGFHVDNCLMLYGRAPTIILLDFYDAMGSAPFQAAAQFNGIAAPTATVTPYTQTASAGPSATSGSSGGKGTGSGDAQVSTQPIPGSAATREGAGLLFALVSVSLALLI